MLNSCVMHRHTGPAPGIMVSGGIGYHSRIPLVRIAGTLNSQRYISRRWSQLSFLTFRAWSQPYFNRIMRGHTWPALSKGSSSITRLNCFPGWHTQDLSPIENMWSMVAQRLTQITLPAATPEQLWQRVELLSLLYPKNTSKVSLN
ncbi:transposable element Tc3 transposase [Trichonephila clavipes]|nr:transposable element Tc3 transposase [Trichonephila clavipes]